MEWVFAHMTDPDFNDPPQQQQQPTATAGVPAPAAPAPSAEALSSLTAMGFTERQVRSGAGQHCFFTDWALHLWTSGLYP